jgi:hypothetical protein
MSGGQVVADVKKKVARITKLRLLMKKGLKRIRFSGLCNSRPSSEVLAN